MADTTFKVLICDALKDILNIECIVNSTNRRMIARAGFDARLRKKAGKALADECKKHGGLEKNDPIVTSSYELSNYKWIIHIYLSDWDSSKKDGSRKKYYEAYQSILEKAKTNNIKSIVLPPLGMKYRKVPDSEGVRLAVKSVVEYVRNNPFAFDCIAFATNDSSEAKARMYCHELDNLAIDFDYRNLSWERHCKENNIEVLPLLEDSEMSKSLIDEINFFFIITLRKLAEEYGISEEQAIEYSKILLEKLKEIGFTYDNLVGIIEILPVNPKIKGLLMSVLNEFKTSISEMLNCFSSNLDKSLEERFETLIHNVYAYNKERHSNNKET